MFLHPGPFSCGASCEQEEDPVFGTERNRTSSPEQTRNIPKTRHSQDKTITRERDKENTRRGKVRTGKAKKKLYHTQGQLPCCLTLCHTLGQDHSLCWCKGSFPILCRKQKMPQDKTQDKTRQDKTRQDKTRQYKTRQDKTRQTRQDKTRQDKTRRSSLYYLLWTMYCVLRS